MTKYAVLKIKGTQYKVLEGEEILVAKLGDTKVQADMLLLVEDDKELNKIYNEYKSGKMTYHHIQEMTIDEEVIFDINHTICNSSGLCRHQSGWDWKAEL